MREVADRVVQRVDLTTAEQRLLFAEMADATPSEIKDFIEEAKERAMPQKRKGQEC